MSTITLSHKASKLMKLCDAEGFETLDDLLALSITDTFGGVGANELQLARFVLAEVPKAAVGPYLRQGVAPPTIVDEIIGATYYAIVGKFGAARKRRSPSINS